MPHTLAAVERGADAAAVGELVRLTLARWRGVRESLARFVSKHDHRHRAPFSDDETQSYERAFATLAGAAGLLGNDVHGRARVEDRG